MKPKPDPKKSNEGYQTNIADSKSWIVALQHYNTENTLVIPVKQNLKQRPYIIASTFDSWLAIKTVNIQIQRWEKIYQMKMTMPVINSYLQFNKNFEPIGLVLAYFDGSIDYSPWQKIQQKFAPQIYAGKHRVMKKTFPDVIKVTSRLAYINTIVDESQSIEEAFMLQTVCFLHKKGEHIFSINFKGQFKIFQVVQKQNKLQLVTKVDFKCKVIKAEHLIGKDQAEKDSILVAVCFFGITIPIILQLSLKTTTQQIQQKTAYIFQKLLAQGDFHSQNNAQIKLLTYEPFTKLIIIANQNNKIGIYSIQKQQYNKNEFVFFALLQKAFSIHYKGNQEMINDISVKQKKLAIICKNSFCIFDLEEDFMIKQGQKLKDQIQFGKLLAPQSQKRKNLLLLKKKFDYQDPSVRKSTTLHLFIGK